MELFIYDLWLLDHFHFTIFVYVGVGVFDIYIYAKFLLIQYSIDIDILQNSLININIFHLSIYIGLLICLINMSSTPTPSP